VAGDAGHRLRTGHISLAASTVTSASSTMTSYE
jgi:hypothetical protein